MGRYLGIDNGEKRVGLALSDPLKIIATPFRTLLVHNTNQVIRELDKIIDEQDVELIVVGNPLGMKGQQTVQTKRVMEFTDKLRDIGYKVMLEDERLSSVSAKRVMIEQEIKTGYNKELIDQTAAAIILQQFLDKQSKM
ncbi:MAG TPA: Holliday junction resolvase RuvX [Candidatus Marinimicrobia bacterium]|nr:Holliday junction resolvase RuvX [Candidatus Neomarinimicrobiota bacterium]